MNSIEETLWNYIDGNCTPDEQKAVSVLIEQDEAYRKKYNELLALNQEFAAMEFDEPPMAFTYNVMEAVRAEEALKPLKAAINKKVIRTISIFFIFMLSVSLVFVLANIHLTSGGDTATLAEKFRLPNIKSYITPPMIEGFLFLDVILALYMFDAFLRKRHQHKEV